MLFLFPILFALGVSGAAELGVRTEWVLPWLVLPLLVAPHAVLVLARAWRRAGRLRTALRLERTLAWLPVAGQGLAVCGLGYGVWLEGAFGLDVTVLDWPGFGIFALLVPFLVLELLCCDARTRTTGLSGPRGRALRAFQVRHALAGFGPIFVYVLLGWPVRHWEWLEVMVEEVSLAGAAWTLVLLVAFALTMPSLLRTAWDTVPLPTGPSRTLLDDLAARAHWRYRELYLWRTGDLVANAAIVGFGPRQRSVLLSDALLRRLHPRELAAVFCHEIGHSLRRHVWAFAAWTLGVFLGADLLLTELVERWPDSMSAQLFAMGAVAIAWYLGFGYLSRRFELDADLASLELTGDPGALAAALEKVAGGHARERDSWRHFSTARRVRFLGAVAADPAVGGRLRKRLGLFVFAASALFAFTAVVSLAGLARDYRDERIAAELRLGHFGQAAERAQHAGVDPDLVELTRLATQLQRAGLASEPARWVELARTDLDRRDVVRARLLLELASLRGVEAARPPLEVLYLLDLGRWDDAREQAAALTAEWPALGAVCREAAPADPPERSSDPLE